MPIYPSINVKNLIRKVKGDILLNMVKKRKHVLFLYHPQVKLDLLVMLCSKKTLKKAKHNFQLIHIRYMNFRTKLKFEYGKVKMIFNIQLTEES
ncbi:hypothetical protein JTB14_007914 [Gonioctena quinquepunctata]|nr:hypothetical protein JTB14_007914 [Gonioctena quinquepunctata]